VVAAIVLAGCPVNPPNSENTNITIDNVKGEWKFENVNVGSTNYPHAHLSLLAYSGGAATIALSLGQSNAYDGPSYIATGTMSKNVFTGTYVQQANTKSSKQLEVYSLTITFALVDSQLKATFAGDGPLNQVVLENGAKQSVQENTTVTASNVLGEWDFTHMISKNQTYDNVHVSVLPNPHEEGSLSHYGLDIHYGDYFIMSDGDFAGNVYTGKYEYQIVTPVTSEDKAASKMVGTLSMISLQPSLLSTTRCR